MSNSPNGLHIRATLLKAKLEEKYQRQTAYGAALDRILDGRGKMLISFFDGVSPEILLDWIDLKEMKSSFCIGKISDFLVVYGNDQLPIALLEKELQQINIQLAALGEGQQSVAGSPRGDGD